MWTCWGRMPGQACVKAPQGLPLECGSRALLRSPGGEAREPTFAAGQFSHIQARELVGQNLDRSRCGGESLLSSRGSVCDKADRR